MSILPVSFFNVFGWPTIVTRKPCIATIPALVLAAGASARLGRPKALLGLPGREGTLMASAVAQARLLTPEVRVVVGARYPRVRFRSGAQPSRWIVCRQWEEGMSASLKAGLRSFGPRPIGVYVLVVDQPLLDPAALQAFAERVRRNPGLPWAADYGGKPGVPAFIPRSLWDRVFGLEGDRGAGRLLSEWRAGLCDMPGVHDDVDTDQDWRRIRQQFSQIAPIARQFRR